MNIPTLVFAITNGWIAANLLRFQSKDSPIGPISQAEIALVVSTQCLGAVAGTVLFGYLADWCGRKRTLLIMSLPQLVASLLLILGTKPIHVYIARVLFGLTGGGVFTVTPIFVAEISQESIRGALGSIFSVNCTIGTFLGYILGAWMDYLTVPYLCTSLSLAFMATFLLLPETPDYLSQMRDTGKAKKSYEFYGNHRAEVAPKEDVDSSITWSDFQDPAVRRGCIIAFTLIFFTDLCGVLTITYYMTELLTWAKITLIDVYVGTVGIAFLQILGCGISALCMDRFGRRILFIVSAVFSSLALYGFALYFYVLKSYRDVLVGQLQWLPIAALGLAILSFSLAIGAAPFFLIAELLPIKVRGRSTTVALTLSWTLSFLSLQSFHNLVGWVDVQGTYCIYATLCLAEALFVYFYLPETKNLSFDQIQVKLAERRRKVIDLNEQK